MARTLTTRLIPAALLCATGLAAADEGPLEEVVVTATLREVRLADFDGSVTVLSAPLLQDAGVQHFEDVIGLVPNLGFAAGSSRPRYFQIRGIGELEQYQGAPNPSVGFLIDDVDFSGLGMPATLFDVAQIEVLRGPQGTRYGANALAGLIAVRGRAPASDFSVQTELTAGEYGTQAAGLVVTGPVTLFGSAFRASVQQARSDGFQRNAFLERDDTNDRDELSARFAWHAKPMPGTEVDLTLLHFDLDNGYDAFAIDNSRRTLSDDPGQDSQRATGGSVRWNQAVGADTTLTMVASGVESDSVHAYDGDWGNAASWAPYTYDFIYRADRRRETRSLELRLESAPGELAWLLGAYALDLNEQIDELSAGRYVDPFFDFTLDVDDRSVSDYDARTYALFGQLDGAVGEHWSWSVGLRGEERDASYRSRDPRSADPAPLTELEARDRMAGGQVTLSRALGADVRAYSSVSRGYKAGGFNLSAQLPEDRLEFEPEYLWNLELGLRGTVLDGAVDFDAALFHAWRDAVQIRTGEQLVAGDPNSFVFYTGNAASGRTYGLETRFNWRVGRGIELFGAAGLLEARYEDYVLPDGTVSSREQPHAPSYTYAVGAAWRHASGWMARVDVTGSDSFYFDVPPNPTRSDAYTLTHLRIGYEAQRWQAYAWARNAFDETYATRGFYFGNEPPDFPNELYVQLGEPRQVGVTVRVEF
ncbi:MAG TPA: TonB-dependent receptor plug domain-containing protein [Steroidobacteraceae bacterium]|nr:TonB-dependent receptor plug domain-containing protein [Steroidobacteraceae bacterium]